MVSKRAKQTTTKTTSIHRHHEKKNLQKKDLINNSQEGHGAVVPKNGTLAGHHLSACESVTEAGAQNS